MFQFQSGAIKRSCRLYQRTNLHRGFNSNLVRLKVAKIPALQLRGRGFNSNLVRLKGGVIASAFAVEQLFQFQSGAIKRGHHVVKRGSEIRFNSNLVRLKAGFFCVP